RSLDTTLMPRRSVQVSSTACCTSLRPAPTRMASTTSLSTSSSSRRLRSPARAFGGAATTVPTPGCAINQRSWIRCCTTLWAVFGWILRSNASVRTEGKASPAFSSPARMDLMAAKHTWSKMDSPGLNLILKGTMGAPVSHGYCETWGGAREAPGIDSAVTCIQDPAMNKLAGRVAGMLTLDIDTGVASEEKVQIHGKTGIVVGRFDANGTYE